MKKIEIIGLVVFISFIVWAIITRDINQTSLLNDGEIITVKIVNWHVGSKGTNGGFSCAFYYQGKHFQLNSPTTYKGSWPKLVGKTFPGMFSPKRTILEILITPEDFKKFDIPFPDSLDWVRQENH